MNAKTWEKTAAKEQSKEVAMKVQDTVVNITLDLKSYKQYSGKVQEVIERYEEKVSENEGLRDRINKLVAQYDQETNARRQGQKNQADKDLQLLQAARLRRNNEVSGVSR